MKKACFTNSDELLIQDFNRCADSVFNNAVLRERKVSGKHYGTHLSGYLAYELFHGPFGTKNSTGDIRLPDWIYSANKEFISGFLGAMIDGDGTVQHDGYRVQYASASKNLVHEIQDLLRIHGVSSGIRVDNNSGTIAHFGDTEAIRKYDTHYLYISHDAPKLNELDSFKITSTLKTDKESRHNKDLDIISIEAINYDRDVYDFETEDHYFNANGFKVHNCCQIDLDKLFTGGFNTGHGFLREPGEIRSYAALACIAIQSNQNDMHRIA